MSVQGNQICQSEFIEAIREVIHHEHKDDLISALEKVRDTDEDPEKILDWFNIDLNDEEQFELEQFENLISGELNWAIETAAYSEPAPGVSNDWIGDPTEIEKLLRGDLNELAIVWKLSGCKTNPIRDIHIDSKYELALFGIESPGGFQSWNAARGVAKRYNWLDKMPFSVTVDTYGTFSPEPAASRLFVPNERGDAVRGAVNMAFLRHAKSLAVRHSVSKDWLKWFGALIKNWEGTGLTPSQVREFCEELKCEPALPSNSTGLWAVAAARHSAFGRFVTDRR